MKLKQFGEEGKIYRGSMIIRNDEEDDYDDDDEDVDVTEIFKDPL